MSEKGRPFSPRARPFWLAVIAADALYQIRFPFRSRATIERAQRRRLRRAVAHAFEHVPHYRETMQRLGLGPGDFRTADDLTKLPLIDRQQLQRDPERFVSRAQPIDAYVKLRSGGSTGEPITVFKDRLSLVRASAHSERLRSLMIRLAGRRFRYRVAALGPPSSSSRTVNEEGRRLAGGVAGLRFESQHLSLLDPPARIVRRLNELKPDAITSYGSGIESLFTYLEASGDEFHRPGIVHWGGDPLSGRIRQLITDRFGIRVISSYGAIEAPMIGFECEEHRGYHVNIDLCPMRLIDSNGEEVPDGESGEVVISNLMNRGTVLLNYKLGDRASWLDPDCPCGRSLPMLSFIEGRSVEWLMLPSGERLNPLAVATFLRHDEGLRRYQVVQESPTRFKIAAIVVPGADREAMRARLERIFAELVGDEVDVKVSFPDSLPRTAGGKVRPFVSMVDRGAASGVPGS